MFAIKVTKKDGKQHDVMLHNIGTIEPVECKPATEAKPAKARAPGGAPSEEAKAEVKATPAVPESAILHLVSGGDMPVLNTLRELLALING